MSRRSKFEEFNDGVCNIYNVNDDEKLEVVGNPIRFGEETVGVKRHYAAKTAGQEISVVIHVPMQYWIEPDQIVVIGDVQYMIEQVQRDKHTMPPINKLTLSMLSMHKRKEFLDVE